MGFRGDDEPFGQPRRWIRGLRSDFWRKSGSGSKCARAPIDESRAIGGSDLLGLPVLFARFRQGEETAGYFNEPTPGKVNGTNSVSLAMPPEFSVGPRLLRRTVPPDALHGRDRRQDSLHLERQTAHACQCDSLQKPDRDLGNHAGSCGDPCAMGKWSRGPLPTRTFLPTTS